jgi:predicted dithiol-disulfide oxidoreductase (DUF899 family)
MSARQIVSREEWLVARKALLAKEKQATRQRDALTAERMRLPMVRIDKPYVFQGPLGPQSLADLFAGQPQLLIYHFMFQPEWNEGCKSCSHFMDTSAGAVIHLRARHTAFVVVSLAPFEKIDAFRRRMNWDFPWVSSYGSDFNRDFEVSIDVADERSNYNYARSKNLLEAGKIWFPKGELPGLSAFLREGNDIYHTYSAYQRGLDLFLNTYNFLDVTPLGRHEEDAPGQSWIRHHDRYSA